MWVSAWASAGCSSELECSAVRLAAIPYRVSSGFSSIDAGMYVRAAALHRRSPPSSAVLPSEGGRCAVTDAPLPRRPRLCPSWRRLRPPPRCYYDRSLCFFWLIVLCVSQPKMSRGVVLYGYRKCQVPWIPPEFFLALPGLCRLVLTCSHDSLFLRYPAIDIVWRGPVFLALGFLRHLAIHDSAWWSPGLGWCSRQAFSRTSVLPILTLTHALTVYNTPPVVSALASNPYGELVTVLCLRSHHCLTVSGSAGQWCPMMRTWECGWFLLHLPLRVPPCLPFGLATLGSVAAFLS